MEALVTGLLWAWHAEGVSMFWCVLCDTNQGTDVSVVSVPAVQDGWVGMSVAALMTPARFGGSAYCVVMILVPSELLTTLINV